jgi:hypothetical protein
MDFDVCLEWIWLAHDMNCLTKFYFKALTFDEKYITYLAKSRLWVFISEIFKRDCRWTFLPAKILYHISRFVFLCFCFSPIYYANMAPFYLLAIPFEYFLFQNNFILNGIITKNFVVFWTLPASFGSFWYFLFFRDAIFNDQKWFKIEPKSLEKAAECHWSRRMRRKGHADCCILFVILFGSVLYHFIVGFIYSLPFCPFMMIHGEANE